MSLKQTLSRHWFRFQRELFPWLEETLGPLGERYERLVGVVELVRVDEWLPYSGGWRGRPLKDRAALARAFLAKAVLDVPTTRGLVERLRTEGLLRRLYGGRGGAERGDLLARLCGIRRERSAGAPA